MLFENEIAKVGYLSRSVPEGIDLKEAILKMKVEKNAVILAHYYVSEDIQSIADFVGDSLALAQASKKQSADIIVFCGVHFMAESADILTSPNQTVILPDLAAGCSMADMATASQVQDCWQVLEKLGVAKQTIPITYMNSSAAIKSFTCNHSVCHFCISLCFQSHHFVNPFGCGHFFQFRSDDGCWAFHGCFHCTRKS
mgnify:CR=1 FL=1